MKLLTSRLRQLDDPKLSRDQRAELRCQLVKECVERGDYETAHQAMGELWQRIGERPNVEGLEPVTAGEVLLRAGSLTGLLGSKNQITGAHEEAKNLITESLTIFQSLRYGKKIAEAQIELALCYWRTGEQGEARDYLKAALARLTTDSELKARALICRAIVELEVACFVDALRILQDNVSLFEKIKSHMIKGSYPITLANVFESLWEIEKKADYLDRAFIEFTAAGYHFEEAGHKPYRANVENNLGFLYFKVQKYKEAHEHLDRARSLLVSLKNTNFVAQVDETRARTFLAEKRYPEAERAARSAVNLLDKGGQRGLLCEALITHGRALARLECYDEAYSVWLRAVRIAQECGAVNRAGEAALIIIDELGEHLTFEKIKDAFQVSDLVELRRYEHELIEKALIRAEGRISRAAHLLGTSHQHLARMLQGRHRDLLPLRTPVKPRPKQLTK